MDVFEESAAEVLRAAGLRVTPQRAAVVEILQELHYATAEEIFEGLVALFPTSRLSTVYRAVLQLEEVGVVCRAPIRDGVLTFVLCEGEPHVHAACVGCGTVTCLLEPLVEQVSTRLMADRGFCVNVGQLVMRGLCRACQLRHPGAVSRSW